MVPVLLGATVAGAGAPPRPTEATVGVNLGVSGDPLNIFSNVAVALDRRAPQSLVAAANHVNGDAQALFTSSDGGATWSRASMALGSALFHSDPGVAWDSGSVVYASAVGCNPTTCELQVVSSVDRGGTWSDPPTVVHAAPGIDQALIAADDSTSSPCRDTVCTAWNDVRGASTIDLHVTCSDGAVPPWRDTVIKTGSLYGATPSFGPGGELLVSWQNLEAPSIEVARSTDCGRTFSAPTTISGVGAALDLGIPAMCSRRALIYPTMEVDRSPGPRRGFIYTAWADSAPGAICPWNRCEPTCSSDVRFARSEDGGATWSAPTLVHSNGPGVDQFNPWLAVDDFDGAIHVVWYDTRDDPSRLRTHVYYRRSTDGGLTWDPEIRVTTAPTDETEPGADPLYQYGDHNGLAVFQCRAHPMWTDRRDGGGEQIYTARITTDNPPNDIGNTLRLVRGAGTEVLASWGDLGATEIDYRVYRGRGPDFAVNPPVLAGRSGGPDAVTWMDQFSPLAPGAWMYKVRALGPCGLELATW